MNKHLMTPHEINNLDNFIMAWRFDNTVFCDDLVAYHRTNPSNPGVFGANIVNPTVKDSTDVSLKEGPIASMYFERLQQCVNAYIEKYDYCNQYEAWTVAEGTNIQHYKPGGGYHAWHCERTGNTQVNNTRHLVFMTYLNNVFDAGETEFFYQKLKIKPERGVTVIWPADWMFTHRGITAPSEEKMIVTGWFNFKTPEPAGA